MNFIQFTMSSKISGGTLVIAELETSSTIRESVDSPFIPAAAVSLAKMSFSLLKQKLKFLVWHGFHAYQLHSAIDEWIVNPSITTQNKTQYQDLFQGITFRYKIGGLREAARFFQSFHWNPDQSRSSPHWTAGPPQLDLDLLTSSGFKCGSNCFKWMHLF